MPSPKQYQVANLTSRFTTVNDKANSAFDIANSAYAQANAATSTGGGGYTQANNAYTQANAAYGQANSAYTQANSAYGQANNAYTQANAAYGQANSAYSAANTAQTTAQDAYNQANSAYSQANSGYNQANSAYNLANNSYSQANSAYTQANSAYNLANNSYSQANSAYSQANSGYNQANSAYTQANLAYSQANSGYTQANNAYLQANNAYSAANNSNLKLGGVITGTLNVTQDIIIGGNVYLEGNTTFINVATYSVEDSLIYLASNNSLTDSVDIGFMGGKNTSGTYSHTGFARDATDGKWKLFDGLAEEGHIGNVVDFANTKLATLVANVEANTLTVVNGISGNVNFDSGTLFVDSVNDRIGINTTAPSTKIHAYGTSGSTTVMAEGKNSDSAYGRFEMRGRPAGAGQSAGWLLVSSTAGGQDPTNVAGIDFVQEGASGNATAMVFSTHNGTSIGERFRITSSGNTRFQLGSSGNVTITDAASTGGNGGQLRVVKDATSTPATLTIFGYNNLSLNQAASVIDFDLQATGPGGQTAGSIRALNADINEQSAHLAFYTTTNSLSTEAGDAGTERLRITSDGNVGIGTTSPGAKLDIRTDDGVLIKGASGTTDARISLLPASGGRQHSLRNSGSSFELYDDSAGSTKMFWKFSGEVGIGTVSPGTKLDIASTQGSGLTMRYDTSTAYRALITPYWNSTADTRIDFAINNAANQTPSVYMSIGYNGGNIGIGTTSPYSRLQVYQSSSTLPAIWLYRGTQGADSGLPITFGYPYLLIGASEYQINSVQSIGFGYVNTNGHFPPAEIGFKTTSTSGQTYGDLIFGTRNVYTNTAATERMRISSDGNVGIGTTSPLTALHVYGNILLGYAQNNFIRYRTATNWDYYLSAVNDDFSIYDSESAVFLKAFYNGGSTGKYISFLNTLNVNNAGTVGIGVISPSEKLQIYANSNSRLKVKILNDSSGSSARCEFVVNAYGNSWGIGMGAAANNSNAFYINEDSNDADVTRFTIKTGGNVGIGTTSPAYKLDVNGNTRVTGTLQTADLGLSNENLGPNSVDGTQGSWLIQEGENDLFIINQLNGKKYKFKLEEVV